MFDSLGRKIPSQNCRVFSKKTKDFYKFNNVTIDYSNQHSESIDLGFLPKQLDNTLIENRLADILNRIMAARSYCNLCNGISVPFAIRLNHRTGDVGKDLAQYWLPCLKRSFQKKQSGRIFKATLQGETKLHNSLNCTPNTGYDKFLDTPNDKIIVGFFFPSAFKEYDISSQRKQIGYLPELKDLSICLSGHIEIIYSLIMYPDLLYSKTAYSPILCASALEHKDPRMIAIFKSYGSNLEFWMLSQMMTPTKTQVSEQWTGGLTIYQVFSPGTNLQ